MISANYNPKPWTLYIKQKALKSIEKAEQLGALGPMEQLSGKFFGFSFCLVSIYPRSEAEESSNLEMPTGREKNKHVTKCLLSLVRRTRKRRPEQDRKLLTVTALLSHHHSKRTDPTIAPTSKSWVLSPDITSGGHSEAAWPPPGPTRAEAVSEQAKWRASTATLLAGNVPPPLPEWCQWRAQWAWGSIPIPQDLLPSGVNGGRARNLDFHVHLVV